MTVTVVVPSPASMSCDFERSTSILAVGCDTSICLRIVASVTDVRLASGSHVFVSAPQSFHLTRNSQPPSSSLRAPTTRRTS